MQQDSTTRTNNTQEATHVTLLTLQREVGVTHGTLKKYLASLGIEPICFHIGTRSFSILREELAQVKHLKQKMALLAQLLYSFVSRGRSERKEA